MPHLHLNCDLGELEAPALTAALAPLVHAVNVACGGHAGDDDSMRRCIALARTHGLQLGAHPGLAADFGRGPVEGSPGEITAAVLGQIDRLRALADSPLHHVKLHGSLYHAAESDPHLARAVATGIASRFPGTRVVGLPGRAMELACTAAGIGFIPEAFLDRGYQPDGSLVPRGNPGALLTDAGLVIDRIRHWLVHSEVLALDGTPVPLRARTWCLHADSPDALVVAKALVALRKVN